MLDAFSVQDVLFVGFCSLMFGLGVIAAFCWK